MRVIMGKGGCEPLVSPVEVAMMTYVLFNGPHVSVPEAPAQFDRSRESADCASFPR